MENRVECRELFRSHRLRHTRQRELVYTTLASTKLHPTADELFELARVRDPNLSIATVYNALDIFTERGLCRRMTVSRASGAGGGRAGGVCRFDAELAEHVHLSLPDGRVVDVPDELATRLLDGLLEHGGRATIGDVERRLGVRVARASIQLIAEPDSRAWP